MSQNRRRPPIAGDERPSEFVRLAGLDGLETSLTRPTRQPCPTGDYAAIKNGIRELAVRLAGGLRQEHGQFARASRIKLSGLSRSKVAVSAAYAIADEPAVTVKRAASSGNIRQVVDRHGDHYVQNDPTLNAYVTASSASHTLRDFQGGDRAEKPAYRLADQPVMGTAH